MQDPALWQRLEAHQFDAPGATQPYSVKLALAEGWGAAYTAAVIEEYRKFLYLTQVSPGQVTPSEAVDRAWHMHLTFTRDYWEQLCPHVLGRPLHHEPCSGPEEMPRYNRQFDTTRALYVAEFGAQPPAAIWGPVHAEKPPRKLAHAGLYGVSAGVVLLFLDVSTLIAIAVVVGAIAIIGIDKARGARPYRRRRHKDGGGGAGPGGCGTWSSSKGDGGSDGGGGGGCGGGGGGGGCGGGGG